MIAKQIKGRSFRRVLNYLDGKAGARRIGGNMVGKTPPQLTAEFARSQQLNPNLERAVYHTSLAVSRDEAQSEQTWNAIARDYLKGMNFQGCQYVVYRHTDTEHDHIHVVASRTRFSDGATISDSWDYKRSEALVRELERAYNLKAVEPQREGERSLTTGELRQLQRTGETSIRERLQPILAQVSADSPTMPKYIERVLAAGVEVKVFPGSTAIRGISYALDGVAFSGTHLGRDYTFPGLQKHRGIVYDPTQDDDNIKRLIGQGPQLRRDDDLSVTLADGFEISVPSLPQIEQSESPQRDELRAADPLQKRGAAAIAPVAISFFKLMQQQGELELTESGWQYQGKQYAMSYYPATGTFSVSALDGRGELFRLQQVEGQDTVEIAQGINKADLETFYQMEQMVNRQEQQWEIEIQRQQIEME